MESFQRILASYSLFVKLSCCPKDFYLNGNSSVRDDTALAFLEEDKMMCHIIDCLAALSVVQIRRRKHQKEKHTYNEKHDLMKRKVFRAACLMMIDAEFDNDEIVVNTILSAFPDDSMMSDKRSWLPMHFAVALFLENKITEEDVHVLHTTDPLAMYRLSEKKLSNEECTLLGCTPAHLFCMKKEPNMSMVRYFCLRDPKAFLLCDRSGRSALHLAAQYSESIELLQTILQMDETMTNSSFENNEETETKPLGLLCRRLEFPTFHQMIACLIEVDSSVQIIYDGMMGRLESCKNIKPEDQHLHPGSQGENTLILLDILFKANPDASNYRNSVIFLEACSCLTGELGVAVLSLFLTKDNSGLTFVDVDGYLSIHFAALYSSLDVLKFLHKAYPESLFTVTNDGSNLLHLAASGLSNDIMDMREKLQYLCDQCPAFIHQKNTDGFTPLHDALVYGNEINVNSMICLCNIDEMIVRDKCTPPNVDIPRFEQLPLHLLITFKRLRSELSDEADCFRLFLRLYPASAGIKDGHLVSPYDLAVSRNLSVYFIRLLLNADPTIDPVRRHNLNFDARRDGMFLGFRALTANIKPTIWAKIRYEGRDLLSRVISYL